tara:strand:+ start:2551 stop:3333 length:783 start_codon:yes stop_codon:yes gene_type:complete
MNHDQAKKAANILWDAYNNKKQIDSLPRSLRAETIEDGYIIQDQLVKVSGAKLRGYKVGATNKSVQARFGVDMPFSGRILEPFILQGPAIIPKNTVNFYAIEAEFDFLIGKTLPPRSTSYSREEIYNSIDTILPAIELPDSRYKNWLNVSAPDLIADNAISGILVLGSPIKIPLPRNLSDAEVIIKVNDNIVSQGIGKNVLEDPWNVIFWLVEHLNERGLGLMAGDIITTGSTTDVIHCKPQDNVECDFGKYGSVSLYFE